MKTISIVLVALSLAVVLSSCSVKTSSGPEAGTPTPPSPAAKTETEAPATTEAGAKVVELVVGDKFDAESKKITNETKSFAVDTPEIFVNAAITGLTSGAKITGALSAVDVKLADGTEVKDKELKSVDVESPGEEATARFSFTPPEKGWPAGTYVVKVSVDGQEVDSAELTVEAGQ